MMSFNNRTLFMERKDLNRLVHMLDAAVAVEQHIASKKESDLDLDRLLLGGVIHELLIIGEAANAVSSQTRNNLPNIPWKEIIGMRNQLIHCYFEISHKIVWKTLREDIPKLILELQKVIPKG